MHNQQEYIKMIAKTNTKGESPKGDAVKGQAQKITRRPHSKKKGHATSDDKIIGQNLQIWRKRRGLSQEALGDKIGVTFQQIQKYERGTNRLAASRLVPLAEILEITPLTLLGAPEKSATKLSNAEYALFSDICALNKKQKRIVRSMLNSFK